MATITVRYQYTYQQWVFQRRRHRERDPSDWWKAHTRMSQQHKQFNTRLKTNLSTNQCSVK